MGFLGRVTKGLAGLADFAEAGPQFLWDVTKALDEPDGLVSAAWESAMNRSGQAISGLFGREGFGGQVIGAIPEPLRQIPKKVIGSGHSEDLPGFGWREAFGGGALGFLEGAGREFIREPISTALTAASLSQSATFNDGKQPGFFDGFGSMLNKKTWQRAQEIAQTRSMGQAWAAAILTKDILDPDEMVKAQGSGWFNFLSGGIDLAARIWLDPDVLLLKAGKIAKGQTAIGKLTQAEGLLEEAVSARSKISTAAAAAEQGRAVIARGKTGRALTEADAGIAKLVEGKKVLTAGPATEGVSKWRMALGRMDDAVAAELDDAINAAKAGDDTTLWEWATRNRFAIKRAQVANIADEADGLVRNVTEQFAKRNGFDAIDFTDEAAAAAAGRRAKTDIFDLGTVDDKLAGQIRRTQKRYGENPYAQDVLKQREFVKLKFEAWRSGGFDELMKQANNNVYQLSDELKLARDEFMQSKQWSKTERFLSEQFSNPAITAGQRTELIRDRMLRNTTDGDTIAHWLANAYTKQERESVMRVLLGDFRSIERLRETNPAMARDIELVAKRRFLSRKYSNAGMFKDTLEEFELLNNPDVAIRTSQRWADVFETAGRTVDEVEQDISYYLRGMDRELLDPQTAKPWQITRAQWQNRLSNVGKPGERAATMADDALAPADETIGATPMFSMEDRLSDRIFGTPGTSGRTVEIDKGKLDELIDSANKWDERVAANKAKNAQRQARGPRRGIEAIDQRITREMSQRPEMGMTRDARDIVGRFAAEVGEQLFDDLALSIRKAPNKNPLGGTPMGQYDFGKRLAVIFEPALREGKADRTMIHEMLHHISAYVPKDDVVKLEQQLVRQRAKFLKANPVVADKLSALSGARQTWADVRWTTKEFDALVDQFGADTVAKLLGPTAGGLPTRPVYQLRTTADAYRLFNTDEFFAEAVADIAIRRLNPTEPLTIVDKAKTILEQVIAWIAKVSGRDAAARVYEKFRFAEYADETGQTLRQRDTAMFQRAKSVFSQADEAGVIEKNAGKIDEHRKAVEEALKAGEHVPGEVMADYPELARQFKRAAVNADTASSATLELQRMMMLADQQKSLLKLGGNFRSANVVEKVWENPHNKLRVLFDMRAQPYIVPDDPMVVGKLKRHLRAAGFTKADQQELLGRFAAVRWDDGARSSLLHEIQAKSIKALAEKRGVGPETVERVMTELLEAQGVASKFLSTAKLYAGRGNEGNWSKITINGENGIEHIFLPLTPEQLGNAHLMPNYKDIDRALQLEASWVKRGFAKGADYPTAAAELVNKYWKPTALMRPAWPMRVVFDEQIRMMSAMGVMENLGQYPERFREMKMKYYRKLWPELDANKNAVFLGRDIEGNLIKSADEASMRLAQAVANPSRAARGMGILGGAAGYALAGPQGAALGASVGAWRGYRNAQYANGLQALYLSNTRGAFADGYTWMLAMGNPGHVANIAKDEVSAARQLDSMLLSDPAVNAGELKLDRARWRIYTPDDPGYETMWNQAVNRQFSNSEFSKMLWNDNKSHDDIVEWLTSPAGRSTLDQMPSAWQKDPALWVERARGFVNTDLLPPTPETMALRAKLAQGEKVSISEVKDAIGPNWDTVLGSVHGQNIIELADRQSRLGRFAKKKVDRIMDHLGVTPTDTLSRQPFFEFQYREQINRQTARMAQAMGPDDVYRMSQKELRNIEDTARRVALKNTRHLLYDLAEESEFGHMVRFLMPFYNAWQEVLTRYAGIALDNPVYLSRVAKAYKGLDEIGETYTDPGTGQEIQRFRIPEWAKPLVNAGMFASAIDDQGYIAFNKRGLNMISQGTPAFGPLVTMPVSLAVNDKPELEDSLSFMFPYGPTKDLADAFAPAWARRLLSAETEDRAFKATMGRIAIDRLITAELNGEPIDFSDPKTAHDFYAEVKLQTSRFYKLRTVASLTLPLAPQWQSPYQDYIDEWRKLQREDPLNAEQKFLKAHSEDYFALTQAMSKVFDGVPATVEGEAARKKYEDLIELFPEFGKLIIGEEGGGVAVKFSRSVYDKQMSEKISQGSGQTRRAHLPLEELVAQPNVRLGWNKWSRFNDWKTQRMQELGITSLTQRGGEDIAAKQRALIAGLAQAYPEWYKDFVEVDDTKWLRRMEAFDKIANTSNPDLYKRDDIRGLRAYMQARSYVEEILAKRDAAGGSADLRARSNQDLLLAWEMTQNQLVETNPAFADLHSRWLSNDPVARDSWIGAAA